MENTELVSLSEKAVTKIKEYTEKMPEAQGKDLALLITSAYLLDNRISEGPYRAQTGRAFRVGP